MLVCTSWTLARISSAVAVHMNGLESVFHVQRGEQIRRAVSHVVVAALLDRVERDRQHPLGPVEGLDLGFPIARQHHRPARRIEAEARHVGYLGGELRAHHNTIRARVATDPDTSALFTSAANSAR